MRSAGPFSAAPPTMGDTATTLSRRRHEGRSDAGHRHDRADRDDRVRRGDDHDVGRLQGGEDTGSRAGLLHAREPHPRDGDVVVAADEVLLEADLAFAFDHDPGLDPVVAHGQQADGDPEGRADLGCDLRQRGPSRRRWVR